MRIKAYTSYSERTDTHYYRDFDIVGCIPTIGQEIWGSEYNGQHEIVKQVNPVELDCEQSNPEVYQYDYYQVITIVEELNDDGEWELDFEAVKYIAIKNEVYDLMR